MSRRVTNLPRGDSAIRMGVLLTLVLLYAAASLLHHVHNAEFLSHYPNMPAWLTRAKVYAAWLAVSAIGAAGWLLLLHSRFRFTGLAVLGVYGCLGFAGLDHYAVAPLSAHTATMNLTIGLEVATAAMLVVAVVWAGSRLRQWNRDHAAS